MATKITIPKNTISDVETGFAHKFATNHMLVERAHEAFSLQLDYCRENNIDAEKDVLAFQLFTDYQKLKQGYDKLVTLNLETTMQQIQAGQKWDELTDVVIQISSVGALIDYTFTDADTPLLEQLNNYNIPFSRFKFTFEKQENIDLFKKLISNASLTITWITNSKVQDDIAETFANAFVTNQKMQLLMIDNIISDEAQTMIDTARIVNKRTFSDFCTKQYDAVKVWGAENPNMLKSFQDEYGPIINRIIEGDDSIFLCKLNMLT